MTERIYGGYIKRYETWCISQERDPTEIETFREYQKHLYSRNKSNLYITNTMNAIRRKWFNTLPRAPAGGTVSGNRASKRFTSEQIHTIRKYAVENYKHNELALLLILLIDTVLNPRKVLAGFNNLENRISIQKQMTSLDTGFFSSLPTTVFPKTHHAYLIQFKHLLKKIFNDTNLEKEGSFEMLKRSVHKNKH